MNQAHSNFGQRFLQCRGRLFGGLVRPFESAVRFSKGFLGLSLRKNDEVSLSRLQHAPGEEAREDQATAERAQGKGGPLLPCPGRGGDDFDAPVPAKEEPCASRSQVP